MKKLLVGSLVAFILTGCAVMKTETVQMDGDKVVFKETAKVYSFGSKSMVKGFTAQKKTKTTSALMSVDDAGTQTEIEKLQGLVEAAVAGAVKGAK